MKFPFQVVGNHRLKFMHVFAVFPGNVHDMRVFKNSGVQAMCLYHENACFPRNTHLIVDSAYTNQKHVIVPFKGNGDLTVKEINKLLSSNRVFVECAIGLLKVKFRRLLDMCSMDAICLNFSYFPDSDFYVCVKI